MSASTLNLPQLILGLALAGLIAFLAYRRGSLSRSGALGAVLIGTLVFGLGGLPYGVLLVAFFVSSSALSHYKEARKAALAEKFSKGHQRDLAQTLANGGAGALCALALAFGPAPWAGLAFAAAMAAVNADTWATELGVLSGGRPRLITTFQTVEAGTSGGVSGAGTLAALAGAGLIGLLAGLFNALGWGAQNDWGAALSPFWLVIIVTAAGLFGSLFDSWLGATVQAIYFCPACGKETERHPVHTCGAATRPRRGWPWLDNDWVNFLSSVAGALLAVALGLVVGLTGS
ncbi:MAG: DUF92 domain-containing protein [Anaerolineales bacterium]|nr:DUF92 domain-containing protein [Anaerolineales bacterium]